ncbi:TetR/AcrR family transcriptional regulator [Ferrimonas sp. YFM]|uniref:TetR/AcrR family transcriptional regulator n=1 Tax=Ferrimonas sp. YFM TaxID=3028878 RepID=UPI002573DC26|nr:TetR/AcrR family transcriptional regulator [Ferrimonas sp. YFM]
MKQTKDERIQRIQDALMRLARSHNINNISIYDIASEAHMSSSTIYSYYPNVESLMYVMMTKVFDDFIEVTRTCLDDKCIEHWKDINRHIEYSLMEYCDNNPLAKKLLYSQHPFVSIKEASKDIDQQLGVEIEKQYARFFKLPELPTGINIFTIALEAGDSLYFSQDEEGKPVPKHIIEESIKLTERYLSYYLPEYLPRK